MMSGFLHLSFLSHPGFICIRIDSQVICQRLPCFFTHCKGQIVIHNTEVDGAEIKGIEEM